MSQAAVRRSKMSQGIGTRSFSGRQQAQRHAASSINHGWRLRPAAHTGWHTVAAAASHAATRHTATAAAAQRRGGTTTDREEDDGFLDTDAHWAEEDDEGDEYEADGWTDELGDEGDGEGALLGFTAQPGDGEDMTAAGTIEVEADNWAETALRATRAVLAGLDQLELYAFRCVCYCVKVNELVHDFMQWARH
jgi:hypothetical protein